jgi:nucleoside-diphosphate-sugar epimerase
LNNIAIFGAAGAIGHSIAAELDRRQSLYRVVGRDRDKLAKTFPKADAVAADLNSPDSAEWAASGIDTIFYTAGVPYNQFRLHPVLMQNTVNAAIQAGVERLIVVSSVYSYGSPRTPKVAETHPREPRAKKGQLRKQQEDIALDVHQAGHLQAAVVHLPDFYGPHAGLSIANPIFRAALDGKRADWLGSPDLPHEFIYVPDAGPVLLDLAARESSYGERWNLGGAATITARNFITRIFQLAGREPQFRSASKLMLRAAGLFNPFMRELVEMFYLQETPVILNDSKLHNHIETVPKTPYDEGIPATLEWMRHSP